MAFAAATHSRNLTDEEWDLHWSLRARTDAPRRRSRANPYV
jgi:hypothetical protein